MVELSNNENDLIPAKAAVEAREFNLQMDEFAKSLEHRYLVPFHKKMGLLALTGIVFRTPVKEGRARGNWQASVGVPIETEIDRLDKDGQGTIEAESRALTELKPFSIIFISNNVIYIVPLEEGHSKRAPAGMVAVTLTELRGTFP
jgi:hypothetical protein